MSSQQPESTSSARSFWPGVLAGAAFGSLNVFFGAKLLASYSVALFIAVPIIVGFLPPLFNGRNRALTFRQAIGHGMSAAALSGISLIVFGLEGLICVLMASPLFLSLAIIGSIIGNSVMLLTRDIRSSQTTAIVVVLLIPFLTLFEQQEIDHRYEQDVQSQTTSIVLDAPPEDVWPHLISFPDLVPPEEFIFNAGIAYPVRAHVEGNGVGAVRYCEFSTGDFVEPITVWDEPRHLAFDVDEVAPTMIEMSPWNIEPHHLHGYFVSTKGEFRLQRLSGNRTRLSGTTWYYQRLSPRPYWDLWGDYIVGKIHERVLEHIRRNVEDGN